MPPWTGVVTVLGAPVFKRLELALPNSAAGFLGLRFSGDIVEAVLAVGNRPALADHLGIDVGFTCCARGDEAAIAVGFENAALQRLARDQCPQCFLRVVSARIVGA